MKKSSLFGCLFCTVNVLTGLFSCSSMPDTKDIPAEKTALLDFNTQAWKYDAENKLYYQLGVQYCTAPEAKDIEVLNIYVPAAYLDAKANGDGTYTASVNKTAKVHGYTSTQAPVLFPLETPGYVMQQPSSSYDPADGIAKYTNEGFVYVFAGMRGRDNGYNKDGSLSYNGGAPWGITDLKAAVRYVRYNAGMLPGDMNEVYTAGMSGGGAQSALMGATGNSSLYTPYLKAIGAALTGKDGKPLSDAVTGSMDWCPITNLDYADEAYEWNMGQFASTGKRPAGTWTEALSKDMAESFAVYFNKLGLVSPDGTKLTLEKSADGMYQAGSYYKYLVSVVETSLNHFLADTKFPYSSGAKEFNAFARFGGGVDMMKQMMGNMSWPQDKPGAVQGGGDGAVVSSEGMRFTAPSDYVDYLNKDGTWVAYDSKTNTVKITSLKDFVTRFKNATKGVGAFDDTDLAQGENKLFGTGTSDALHFDVTMAELIKKNSTVYASYSGWNAALADSMAQGVNSKDSLGTVSQVRQDMYNPLYYLSSYYSGCGTSAVAKHWRIRTGIEQSDTALCTEVDLALALKADKNVSDVDFETVWNMQHTMAERTGAPMENLIAWIHQCAAADHVSGR